MNFYKRYPADYAKKTARLTLAQHGAYTLLLDELYTSETGLPQELDELYRICRAMKRDEQEAVRAVVERFFPVAEDGLRHNERATEELEAAAPALEAARANGKKGGRPKKETQQKPSGFPEQNPDETHSTTHSEPRTKPPQSSDNSPSLRSGESRASRLPKPFALPEEYRSYCLAERPDLNPDRVAENFADYWHGKPGKDGRRLDWLATWRRWVREERAGAKPGGAAADPAWRTEQRERTRLAAPGVAANSAASQFFVDVDARRVPDLTLIGSES